MTSDDIREMTQCAEFGENSSVGIYWANKWSIKMILVRKPWWVDNHLPRHPHFQYIFALERSEGVGWGCEKGVPLFS